jgi:hypothetical protein
MTKESTDLASIELVGIIEDPPLEPGVKRSSLRLYHHLRRGAKDSARVGLRMSRHETSLARPRHLTLVGEVSDAWQRGETHLQPSAPCVQARPYYLST